jgi:hypothetical protein
MSCTLNLISTFLFIIDFVDVYCGKCIRTIYICRHTCLKKGRHVHCILCCIFSSQFLSGNLLCTCKLCIENKC